jgi:hypothetical protein
VIQPPPVPAPQRGQALPTVSRREEATTPARDESKAAPTHGAARIKGLNQIVVEQFHTGLPGVANVEEALRDAKKAQEWLARTCGLRTVLEPLRSGNGYRLVTEQMFKWPEEKDACLALKERIYSYGATYSKEGNGYLFKGYVEKIK